MNTNADALSRIQIDSTKLKEMIPRNNTNVITRAMKNKKEENLNEINYNNNEETTKTLNTDMKTDHLHIWNATSLSDIRYLKKLKFRRNIKLTSDVRNQKENINQNENRNKKN